MTGRNATTDRVWLVFEDDLSHGIQGIFGVYSTWEKAQAAVEAIIRDGRSSYEVVSQDWPVDV